MLVCICLLIYVLRSFKSFCVNINIYQLISFSLASIFRVFENYFDLPLVVICARIVDVIDAKVTKIEILTIR